MTDDNSFDLSDPVAQAFLQEGQRRGASPAFMAASLGNGYSESGWDASNMNGDHGKSQGVMQWNKVDSPDRVAALNAKAQAMGLPVTDPRVQASHWYDENQQNLGITDPKQAFASVLGSLRPQGYKPGGDPSQVIAYGDRLNNTNQLLSQLNGGEGINQDAPAPGAQATSGSIPPQISAMLKAQQQQGGGNENMQLGPALQQLGGILMMRDNPTAGAALISLAKNGAASTTKDTYTSGGYKKIGEQWFISRTNDKTGLPQMIPVDASQVPDDEKQTDTKDPNAVKITGANLLKAGDQFKIANQSMDKLSFSTDDLNRFRQLIQDGRLQVTGFDRAKGLAANWTNSTDANDEELKNLQARVSQSVLDQVKEYEKGATTGKQLDSALQSVLPQGGQYSDRTMLSALDRMTHLNGVAHRANAERAGVLLKQFPSLGDNVMSDVDMGTDASGNPIPINADTYAQRYKVQRQKMLDSEKQYGPDSEGRKTFIQNYTNKANGTMPKVNSPEEARKLPSGTQFTLPDGRIGTVP